ncbi:VOC family protein [Methylobacterium aquaticum]|uniref:Glyoxalase n=1 Tax=Methylobacterium aquaticum TaxID=270351 RepID=A0A0J6SQR5_9HYPH|nr:VOC family protein [Methylobacterium aquaticum]KMO37575.1 glyoxalase [Methylobacterium aquaticum]
MRLGYVIIYVPNVPEALAFYEQAFGIQRRFLHESEQYGELETGTTVLAFANETFTPTHQAFRPNRRAEQAAGAEIAFIVDDVDAAYRHALASDATPCLEPTRKPWGQVVAYVRDLNGFLVELCTEVGG